ncbi:hypothetical protein DFJ77DRAFT_440068 [Powellomyces hirtus]|nr:hypothetical protein DFJ77DRAFT_440068 [Powellomyces hirtus]
MADTTSQALSVPVVVVNMPPSQSAEYPLPSPPPPLPLRLPSSFSREESSWIAETPTAERLLILRAFLQGQPDYNIRSFVLADILCNAFKLDGRWRCALSGSNPDTGTSFHRPLDPDEEFHVINLYRSVSMLHILAIIEGLLVFGFAIAALVLGLALGIRTRKHKRGTETKWDASKHDRFLWWASVFAARWSVWSVPHETEPIQLGTRLIRKYPRVWGVESRLKVLAAALLFVLLFSACVAVCVMAVWAKLQLVEVGVTIPDTLGFDPYTSEWEDWTFGQWMLLFGLANNIAGEGNIDAWFFQLTLLDISDSIELAPNYLLARCWSSTGSSWRR